MSDRNEAIKDGEFMMRVWFNWMVDQRERGWTTIDSIERAAHQARTATEINGIARWKGKGAPPSMPKETRSKPGSRIPKDIDQSRLGPKVDRILTDMEYRGMLLTVQVLKVEAMYSDKPPVFRASLIAIQDRDVKVGTYHGLRREGLAYLSGKVDQLLTV